MNYFVATILILFSLHLLPIDAPLSAIPYYVALGLWVIGFLFLAARARCPRCRVLLLKLFWLQGEWEPYQTKYCPCCGLDLDTPVDAVETSPRNSGR